MKMWMKKFLAFALMSAMLIGDVTPAFASEIGTSSVATGTYTLAENGTLVKTETEETLTEVTTKNEILSEQEKSTENATKENLQDENIVVEDDIILQDDSAEEVIALETESEETGVDTGADGQVTEYDSSMVYEENMLETQNDENAVFAVFVDDREPQYFNTLDTLKDAVNNDENKADTIYNIEIRQSLPLNDTIDFSDVTAKEIRINLCQNTITINADVTIAVNAIFDGKVVVAEGRTLTLLPLYSGEQKRMKLDCWNTAFDFGGYASTLVLGDNSQNEAVYTEIVFNGNRFTGTQNADLKLNGSVFWNGHEAYERMLENGTANFEENERLIFDEISVHNDDFPFVQSDNQEWYEDVTIGSPIQAKHLIMNGVMDVHAMNITESVNVNSYSRIRYSGDTVLTNITITTENLEEHQNLDLEKEKVCNEEGEVLSEGELTLGESLNDGNGRPLIFFNQFTNTLTKEIEDEENWWINENHNWEDSEFYNEDILVKIVVSDNTAENAPILNTSNYNFNTRQNTLGIEVINAEGENNTYSLKVCQYNVMVNVFERVFEENGNGNWRPQFLYEKGFSSIESANAYIKANEDKQKQFNVILTEDITLEEENKTIFDYGDYNTYVQLILDGYDVTVNADATICADYIDGSRCRDTEQGFEIEKISKLVVSENKILTILPQDHEIEQDHMNINYLKFEFDNSNLVLGTMENRSHFQLQEIDFNTPVKNLTINGSLHYTVPLTEGNGIEITDTLKVSNSDAEAGLWVPVTVKDLELNGNISVFDFVSTGVLKTDNDNRFNIVADGNAELNDIEVTINEQNFYSRFVVSMDQKIELGKYGSYTAEQWEEIFANWEDDKEVPEDLYEDINVISHRGQLTINGNIIHDDIHVVPVQLEKYFCWDAARANNPEDKQQFSNWIDFGQITDNDEGETVAIVKKADADKFTLSYPEFCLIKNGNELKTKYAQVGLWRQDTGWVVEYEDYETALAVIEKRKDKEANYEMIIKADMGSEEAPITLKLPKYANWFTISSNNFNRIYIKNAISQTTNVRFVNVGLSSTANYDAKKYELEVYNSAFEVNNLTAKTLNTIHSGIVVNGKANLTNVVMLTPYEEEEINNSSITAYKALNITNVTGNGNLEIHNAFTAKAWKKAATQFTLKGDVAKEVILDLRPLFYDTESRSYYDFLHEEGYFDGETFGEQFQDLMLTGNETPAAFKKFMNAKKITSMDNILFYGMHHENVWPMEYKGGIYFTNIPDALSVSVRKSEGGEIEFLDSFRNWNDMIKHIDSLKQSDWEYFIEVRGNVGADRDTPLKSLTLPSKAKRVYVNGDGNSAIVTSGTKITLKTNTQFNNILLAAVNKKGESIAFTVNVGKYQLTLENILREFGGEEAGFYYNCDMKLAGTAASVVDVVCTDGYDTFNDAISQISKVGIVILHAAFPNPEIEGSNFEYVDYYIENGITGIVELVLDKGVNVNCGEKDFSTKYLTIGTNFDQNTREDMWSSLRAKNITVSDTAELRNANLTAGTDNVGDGKITLNNMIFLNNSNHIEGKVDKKGNSLVNIKGTVAVESEEVNAGDSVVTISLRESNNADYVKLSEGMTLLTAPKASASFFRPDYDGKMEANGGEDDGNPSNDVPIKGEERMGWEEWLVVEHKNEDGTTTYDWAPKTGLYNSGNYIKYGTVREISEDNYIQDTAEVRLWFGIKGVNEHSWDETLHMDFATFEDAVTAIDKLAKLKDGTDKKQKIYEVYTLELLRDIEIGNEKGDLKYKTIKLPSKASELYIQGNGRNIKYTGNVTLRCNTSLGSVLFTPFKTSKGKTTPMMSNFVLGNYTMSIQDYGFSCGYLEETENGYNYTNCLGKITGSAKNSKLVIGVNATLEAENISGVKTIEFKGDGMGIAKDENGNPMLSVLYLFKDIKVKEIVYSDYAVGRLYVEGNLTADQFKVDGEVSAEIYRHPEKKMTVKGANAGNTKEKKSVIFVPYKNEQNKDVYSELSISLLSKDAEGSNITDGMKLMDGKYLNAKDWSVNAVDMNNGNVIFDLNVTANDKNTALYIKK